MTAKLISPMSTLTRALRLNSLIAVVVVTVVSRAAMLVWLLKFRPNICFWHVNECGYIAAALVHGRGFAGGFHHYVAPTAWFAPVYPAILSVLFLLFGTQTFASAVADYVLHICLAAVTAALIVKIGSRLCNPTVGLFAGLVWGIAPQVALPEFLLTEGTVATTLVCTAMFLTLNSSEDAGHSRWLLCGVAWGLAGLTNPAMLALVPMILIYLWKKHKTASVIPSVVAVTICLTLAPWVIRNARVFHRFVPVRDNGLAEIYFANVGYEENLSAGTMEYQLLGEATFVRMIEKKLAIYVSSHPVIFVRDSLLRAWRFWTTPEGLFGYSAAISLLALIGLLMLMRERPTDALPFIGVMGLYPAIYYMSVTYSRYRQPIAPFLHILGCYSLAAASKKLHGRKDRSVLAKALGDNSEAAAAIRLDEH